METKARYVLTGCFTLVAIAGVFAFVYWLHNKGGIGEKTTYRIQFESSVAGLLPGSSVLFNGVRVGEVASLELDRDHPNQVLATVAIDTTAPVRSDTAVSIEFQGLTGAPAVVLTGGTPSGPALMSSDAGPPLLKAPLGAGETLSQSARDALGRLSKMLADNAEALHDAIGNIDTFSQALSRNSGRVDGILAGLERFAGGAGAKGRVPVYNLTVPGDLQPCAQVLDVQLFVPEPGGLMSLNSDKIPVTGAGPLSDTFDVGRFADNIPSLLQTKIIEALENTNCFRSVSRIVGGVDADVQLILDIRDFNVVMEPKPEAIIDVSAKLASDGKIAETRIFRNTAALQSVDAAGAASAFDGAFGKIMVALAPWATRVVEQRTEPKPAPSVPTTPGRM